MGEKRLKQPLAQWDVSPKQAVEIQRQLAGSVRIENDFGKIRYVAGVDVGFEDRNRVTRAAIAVLDIGDLSLKYAAVARLPTSFPYVPGLLSFREIPSILQALEKLPQMPELLLCDGQGIAHPRRLGVASHLGVLCDVPTIGVAKSRLIGEHEPLGEMKGARQPLLDKGEEIGMVLRSRDHVKPLYISPGHRISINSAVDFVERCLTRYRLPETTRWAHRLASVSLENLPQGAVLFE